MSATDLFLQNNLKNFGLNPTDWKLKRLQKMTYKIANVRDRNFFFLGEADTSKKTPAWSKIILASF